MRTKKTLYLMIAVLLAVSVSTIAKEEEKKADIALTAPRTKQTLSLSCHGASSKIACLLTLKNNKDKTIFSEKFRIKNIEQAYIEWGAEEYGFVYANPASKKGGFYVDIATKKHYPIDPKEFHATKYDESRGDETILLDKIKNPILKYLPYKGAHFQIDAGEGYTPDPTDHGFHIKIIWCMADIDQQDKYRKDALAWLKSHGIDTKKVKIVWK